MAPTKRFVNILFILFIIILGCDQISSTPIRKIIENPRKYSGIEVTIKGNVTDSFSFLVVKYFVVNDGSGEIAVVTGRPLPKKGERIQVTGTVEEAFSVGDKQLLVVFEGEARK